MDHRVKPGGDEQRVNGDDESRRCRDAPSHPSFATPKKPSQKISSLKKRREAERRQAHHRAASTSDAARTLSPVFPLRED
jgi:hypothetical protein